MPASHHSVFTGRMPFLTPNQQRQSTEGKPKLTRKLSLKFRHTMVNMEESRAPEFVVVLETGGLSQHNPCTL